MESGSILKSMKKEGAEEAKVNFFKSNEGIALLAKISAREILSNKTFKSELMEVIESQTFEIDRQKLYELGIR